MCTLTLHLYSLLGGGEHPPCVVTLWGCSLCAAQWSGIKHRPLLPSAHPEPVPEATRTTRAKPRDSPAFWGRRWTKPPQEACLRSKAPGSPALCHESDMWTETGRWVNNQSSSPTGIPNTKGHVGLGCFHGSLTPGVIYMEATTELPQSNIKAFGFNQSPTWTASNLTCMLCTPALQKYRLISKSISQFPTKLEKREELH